MFSLSAGAQVQGFSRKSSTPAKTHTIVFSVFHRKLSKEHKNYQRQNFVKWKTEGWWLTQWQTWMGPRKDLNTHTHTHTHARTHAHTHTNTHHTHTNNVCLSSQMLAGKESIVWQVKGKPSSSWWYLSGQDAGETTSRCSSEVDVGVGETCLDVVLHCVG